MLRKVLLAVTLVCLVNCAEADEVTTQDPSRGELLYSTYCLACHNTEVHWREKKLVKDWSSLKLEVDRWQGMSGLGLSDDDITKVTEYLITLHYHYPTPD